VYQDSVEEMRWDNEKLSEEMLGLTECRVQYAGNAIPITTKAATIYFSTFTMLLIFSL